MAIATVRLGRDGMGEQATEEDYDSYVDLVCERIDDLCGFEVNVEVPATREVQATRITGYDSESERQTVSDALVTLWEAWCSGDRAEATQ